MQEVHFASVEECLDYLPEDERRITERLRSLVFEAMPDATEKLAYNVPYYRKHANICFIWPGSVPWGKVTQKGVRFGFTQGNLLEDGEGYLDKGARKQVYWRDFYSLKDIDREKLLPLLHQAILIDAQMAMDKQKERQLKSLSGGAGRQL